MGRSKGVEALERTGHLFAGAFLALAAISLESCSSDSPSFTDVETGGEAGEATGKGGASGSSGNGGKGGSGAMAGKGGSGASGGASGSGDAGSGNLAAGASGEGQGGTGDGGDAGASGGSAGGGDAGSGLVSAGGEAGSGDPSGGSPNAGGAASGQGGASAGEGGSDHAGESSGGAGGHGTPEAPKACSYECSDDDDCDSPGILEYVCDPNTQRCQAPELTCSGHRDCVPFASSWVLACEKDDDCVTKDSVCVDAGGYGRCARAFDEASDCPLPGQVSVTRTRFGTIEDVQVCGATNGRCSDGACFLGCSGPSDCGKGDGDSCDVESGRCTCVADTECASGEVSHCNPDTQRCDECASDFDCFLDPARDRCVDGRCGCSSSDVCSDVIFPAATPVCE